MFGSFLIGVPSREPICSSKPPGNSAQRLFISDTDASFSRQPLVAILAARKPTRTQRPAILGCSASLGHRPVQRSALPRRWSAAPRTPPSSLVFLSAKPKFVRHFKLCSLDLFRNQHLKSTTCSKIRPYLIIFKSNLNQEPNHLNLDLFCQNYLSYDLTY